MLAPETNGEVAVKAWEALSKATGREHAHLALPKQDEKIRFRDVVAQPRKIISSPTWSGIESEKVCYNAGYTNVHELIPWRTLTGRQQLYQDHLWMRAFRRGLLCLPASDRHQDDQSDHEAKSNGKPQVVLNFITPHQKWGIHSTYSDNLLMLTLNRGGPVVWLSETDAQRPAWSITTGSRSSTQRRHRCARGGLPAHEGRYDLHVPRAGEDREYAGLSTDRQSRRHPQLGHPRDSQAYPHDRRLCPAVLRLQLLRNRGVQPRRVRRRPTRSTRSTGEGPYRDQTSQNWRQQNENPRSNRHGAEPRQVHRVPHLLRYLQERLDQSRRC